MNENGLFNPPHTHTTKIPHETPWDVRFALALLPARYLLRSFSNSATDSASPSWLRKPVQPLREAFATAATKEIEANLAQLLEHKDSIFPKGVPTEADALFEQLAENPLGKKIFQENQRLHTKWDSSRDKAFNNLRYYLNRYTKTGKAGLTGISKADIRSGLNGLMFETLYDNALGIGSLAYTYKVERNVLADIRSIYTEVAALELDKDPALVTDDDIFASDNRIIQSTVSNYRTKLAQRVGVSLLPFVKNIPALRAMQMGDLAIGAWGAMWAYDVWGREPTMLESFSWFINDKLNPNYGVGDPIKKSDIVNLYQQFTLKYDRYNAFDRVVANDPESVRIWGQGEKIFERIADLMNKSYNFKHTPIVDKETGRAEDAEHFLFPKFIYLMGHDLIKIREPEWTMAFIEIANSYGIDEVKKVMKMERTDANLRRVVKEYEIDLNPTGHINAISRNITVTINPETGEPELRPQSQAMHELELHEHTAPLHITPQTRALAERLMHNALAAESTTPHTSIAVDQLQHEALKSPEHARG